MAALLGVPLNAPADPVPPPAAVPIVRNLTRSRLGFTREVVIDAPEGDFLSIDSWREVLPRIQNQLATQLRFTVKVVARVQLAETVVDPDNMREMERYTEVWVPLGPWPVPPLANPVSRADDKIRHAIQESNYAEDSRKRFGGVLSLMVLTGPAALMANIPAPAGLPVDGGCRQDLPQHLRRGDQGIWNPQNRDHKCFELCVRAHVANVGGYSVAARKEAARVRGAPFYDEAAPRGPGAMARDRR